MIGSPQTEGDSRRVFPAVGHERDENNTKKSEWLSKVDMPAAMTGRAIWKKDGIKLLGAFISYCKGNLNKLVEKMAPFAKALEKVPGQVAYAMLEKYGCPKATYTARVNEPRNTENVLKDFDAFVSHTLSRLARMELDLTSIDIARLPNRYGGGGIS